MGSLARLPRSQAAFALITLLFLGLGLLGLDRSCLDAADSAYLVSSDAIARGLMPYRDFLAAHPPLLYLIGAPLARLGMGVTPFRVFTLLIIAALGFVVYRLAQIITREGKTAILAGSLTLFAPLGLYFSKLYLNDSLIALLAAGTLLLLMGMPEWRRSLAGLLCVLGLLTKLTFIPIFVIAVIFVLIYRRQSAKQFLLVSIAGTMMAYVAAQIFTDGAFLGDVLGAQASKAYSFTNFYEGLHRIWQIDWPLLVPAVVGLWFAWRYFKAKPEPGHRIPEKAFILFGWLIAGLVVLATLPAEGHDTNLFLVMEPAVAILAAWGLTGLLNRRSPATLALLVVWLLLMVPVLFIRDREYFTRSNSIDVSYVVTAAQERSTDCQPVLLPGCYAVEADRPVTQDFYDQFLWEEKYRRGDEDAIALMDRLKQELAGTKPPVVVFEDDRATIEIVRPELDANYKVDRQSEQWPAITTWVPQADKKPG